MGIVSSQTAIKFLLDCSCLWMAASAARATWAVSSVDILGKPIMMGCMALISCMASSTGRQQAGRLLHATHQHDAPPQQQSVQAQRAAARRLQLDDGVVDADVAEPPSVEPPS